MGQQCWIIQIFIHDNFSFTSKCKIIRSLLSFVYRWLKMTQTQHLTVHPPSAVMRKHEIQFTLWASFWPHGTASTSKRNWKGVTEITITEWVFCLCIIWHDTQAKYINFDTHLHPHRSDSKILQERTIDGIPPICLGKNFTSNVLYC